MMLKKILLFSLVLAGLSLGLQAQKIGYVDTDHIMSQIPEYNASKAEIDRLSQQWQEELERQYGEIERMYREYTAQEVLLPDDVKQQKQEEIFKAERKAKEYRESKFGYDGALFKLQDSKVKIIQDKIFRAVEVVAKRKKVAMVFDKAGELTWMYTDATYDLTDQVLEQMGYGKENNR